MRIIIFVAAMSAALALSCAPTPGTVSPSAPAATPVPPRYSAWSAPTFFTEVNTAELEFANAISKDGLTFYFQRGDASATDTTKKEDIWIVQRKSIGAPWGTPQKLPATINSTSNDRAAYESPDGKALFFASDRPGGRGGFDLWISRRTDVAAGPPDFGWQPAVNLDTLGTAINTPGFDSGPAMWVDDKAGSGQFYFVSNPAGPQNEKVDVYVSVRSSDGTFGPPKIVTELSDPAANEGRPYLRADGLEIYLQSNRAGSLGMTDIWVSTRATTEAPWATPQRVEGVNTTFTDNTPVLSWDGLTLFFASNRTGNGGEIFFSTRTRLAP